MTISIICLYKHVLMLYYTNIKYNYKLNYNNFILFKNFYYSIIINLCNSIIIHFITYY